jgi:hypothetical protein
MTGIPRETVMTTLALVGIGLLLVVGLLFFAFGILNQSGDGGGFGQPTLVPEEYPTPTPEYVPNELLPDESS